MPSEYSKGFLKALRESYEMLGEILTEGIDIRAFSKYSDDRDFQKACETFKNRLQGEKEIRELAGLSNLDKFKEDTEGFVKAVKEASKFLDRRVKDKNARKVEKLKGVHLVYEDKSCFIVSPEGPEYSNAAAYLDGGTANWCIAGKSPEGFWEDYNAALVLYVYKKGVTPRNQYSWAIVFNDEDISENIELYDDEGILFSVIEDRSNNIKEYEYDKCFNEMLARTRLRSRSKFYKIVRDFINNPENHYIYDKIQKREDFEYTVFFVMEGKLEDVERMVEKENLDLTMTFDWCKDNDEINGNLKGMNILEIAFVGKKYDIIRYLISKGARITDDFQSDAFEDDEGSYSVNPLSYAFCKEDKVLAELLLKAGVSIEGNVYTEDDEAYSLFEWTVYTNQVDLAKLMLERDWEDRKDGGMELKNGKLRDYLINDENEEYLLYLACKGESFEMIDLLLSHGVSLEQWRNSQCLISQCIMKNTVSERVIEYLIEKGAEINPNRGESPLLLAVKYEDPYLVKMLLKHGADIENGGDKSNPSPAELARHSKNQTIARIFS